MGAPDAFGKNNHAINIWKIQGDHVTAFIVLHTELIRSKTISQKLQSNKTPILNINGPLQ